MNAFSLHAQGWLLLGIVGQVVFSSRFVLQWIYSEQRGYSAIPLVFWYLSIAGAALLLCYAIHLRDPVFIAGQSGGGLIYLRNLQLHAREMRKCATEQDPC